MKTQISLCFAVLALAGFAHADVICGSLAKDPVFSQASLTTAEGDYYILTSDDAAVTAQIQSLKTAEVCVDATVEGDESQLLNVKSIHASQE